MKIGVLLIIGILITTNIQAQVTEKKSDNLKYAKNILEKALKNNSDQININSKLIPKKENAIKYAEIILFEIYGKKEIEAEKPYEVNLINDYWIINGTLPKGMKGGVFEIVFNSWNGKVIMLTHAK